MSTKRTSTSKRRCFSLFKFVGDERERRKGGEKRELIFIFGIR